MYDELVKSLRQCAEASCAGCKNELVQIGCRGLLQHEAADAIEDLEFACNRYEKDYKDLCAYLPRWIPVTERLPSENGFYLCLYNHNHPGGVAMDDGLSILQWFCGRWNLNEIYTVTHWMPLPEPPKEVRNCDSRNIRERR